MTLPLAALELLEVIPVPMALYSTDGVVLALNPAFISRIGYSLEQIPTLEAWWQLAYPDPQYRHQLLEHWKAHVSAALAGQTPLPPMEAQIRCQNGTPGTFLISRTVIELPQKRAHLVVFYDITERRANEARIIRLGKLYHALSEINQAIVRMEDEAQLFPLVCRMAVDFGDMKLAAIIRPDPDGRSLRPVVAYGSGQEYLKNLWFSTDAEVSEGQGPASRAYREKVNVVVHDFQNQPETRAWHERAARHGWNSNGCFPILRGDRPFALLSVYHEEAGAFDQECIALLGEMVRDIGFSLDSFDREKKRIKAEEELAYRENHFRAYFEKALVGMATTSPEKKWIEVNDTLCRMLGYSRPELLTMTWAQITHHDDLTHNLELFEQLMKGETDEIELNKRLIHKNGQVVFVNLAARAIRRLDGSVSDFVVIFNDITELRKQQHQLEIMVHHDPLTGLPNRLLFNDRLDRALARSRRIDKKVAVCFMDLDGFKPVNDRHGHATGDLLLVEVARRIPNLFRSSDTVARLGGDEFALILTEIDDEKECLQMLLRVMESIGQPFHLIGQVVHISTSIGVTLYPDDPVDGENLLRHADQAMYLAKQAGRHRIEFFDASTSRIVEARSENLSRMEEALEKREFLLYYQPQVDMRTGQVFGMEALIRWQHPNRGLLSPGEFLPLIENSKFELKMSEWVIETALDQLSTWRKAGLELEISINLPASHLQSEGFPRLMATLLNQHPDLAPRWINLEILESAAISDMTAIILKMEACRSLGLHFSIDDFGTGYASLAYLRRLPADTIKIDQSFVRAMLHDSDDLSIVKGVIGLSDAFRKALVAEGVETVEHGCRLLELGCQLGQGYGIARPMPAEQVPQWVKAYVLPVEWRK